MLGLIGSNGMVGKTLLLQKKFDYLFNSNNINQILDLELNLLVIAAPSGSRLYANNNSSKDLDNIKRLLDILQKSCAKQMILVNTLDAIMFPDTPYGGNRKFFAEEILKLNNQHKVIYIGAPVSPFLSKGILYDLKFQKFLDGLDSNGTLQYSPLSNFWTYIQSILLDPRQKFNYCSEPIKNEIILDMFYPNVTKVFRDHSLKYNVDNTVFSKEFVLEEIRNYFRIVV